MRRFACWIATLEPTQGAEMRKTRPCVVLSPEVMNARLLTLLMAPLTRGGFRALFRVPCELKGQAGQVALDQMRCLAATGGGGGGVARTGGIVWGITCVDTTASKLATSCAF